MTQYATLVDPSVQEFDPGNGVTPVVRGYSTPYANPGDAAYVEQTAFEQGVQLVITVVPLAAVYPGGGPAAVDPLIALYNQVQAALAALPNAVLFSAQSLSPSQQAQAQANIGVSPGSGAVLFSAAQSLSAAQLLQARTNMQVMPAVVPEQHGITIDGTPNGNSAKLQSLIDTLSTAGGGVISITNGSKIFLDATVTLKQGVWIVGGGGSKQTGTGQAATFIADHTISTGWIFDTPSTAIKGCGIRGCYITTDMSTPSSVVLGGIRFQKVTYGIIEHCIVSNVTDTAVKLAGGTGCIVSDVGASYIPQGRAALTQPTGVIHVNGTDHLVEKCEAFANIAYTPSSSSLYQCAYYINCLTSWFIANEGEFGDCGWYIDGPGALGPSGAYLCKFIGSRATYNGGHGFYIAGAASYNEFIGCYVYNCSQAGDGLYDGMFLANGSVGTRVERLVGASDTLAAQGGPGSGGRFYQMRYLYNDQNAIYTGDQANKVYDVWGAGDNFSVDTVNIANGGLPAKPPGGSSSSGNRDRSRYRAGQPWYDTTLAKVLFSTGGGVASKWVDNVGGKLTQINQFPPAFSESLQAAGATGDTSTTAWTTGKGTLKTSQKIQQSATVAAQFATPQLTKVVADAAAVTAGECDFSSTGATLVVDPTQPFSVGGYFIEGAVSVAGNATVSLSISWYTSGAVFISTTSGVGSSSAVGPSTAVKVQGTVAAASIPSNAAFAVVTAQITKGGMVAGTDTFFCSQFWAVQGTQANFVYA